LWCWYVRRASGFRGVIGMSLIQRKDYGKTHMRERKKNFKCYTYMCMHVHMHCLPTRVSLLSSKIHKGDDTPKDLYSVGIFMVHPL